MSKPGPKPKGEFAGKGATLSARVTVETRHHLDEAARASGNSISEELELRLRRSFQRETDEVWKFGSPQTHALLRLTAEAIGQVEAITGAQWHTNRFTFDAAAEAAATLMAAFKPKGRSIPPASFPTMPGLEAWPETRRALRAEFAAKRQPLGRVAAQTVVALVQAAQNVDPEVEPEFWNAYRRAGERLAKRLGKPVLPLPPTPGTFRDPQGREWAHEAAYRAAQGSPK